MVSNARLWLNVGWTGSPIWLYVPGDIMILTLGDISAMDMDQVLTDDLGVSVKRFGLCWSVQMEGGGCRIAHTPRRALTYYVQCRRWSK